MRWFKCLLLGLGHMLVNLSLAFITVPDDTVHKESKHFFKWFGIVIGTMVGTVLAGGYLIALPIFPCLKKSKNRAHVMILFVAILYFINLSLMLWALQHILVQSTVIQCYSMSGQIGLVFGLLVLYDNMRGESTKDLYERCMTELDDELELGETNKIGIDDDDLQRD